MNKVILMGRLTRDPDVRWTQGQNQTCVARYTLAVDRRIKKTNESQQTADYISMVSFGSQAEFIEKYIKKEIDIDRNQPFHSDAAEKAAGKSDDGLPQPPWMRGRGSKPAASRMAQHDDHESDAEYHNFPPKGKNRKTEPAKHRKGAGFRHNRNGEFRKRGGFNSHRRSNRPK